MWPLRYQFGLLSALAIQNTILLLLLKSSLQDNGHPATLNVIAVELVKILICTLVELPSHNYSLHSIHTAVMHDPHLAHYALPASLYALQNNLCLIAITKMGPVEYQVVYQSKILVTAVMAWWWLGRRVTLVQWASLVVLVAGVVVVVMPEGGANRRVSVVDEMVGMMAVLTAAVTSGFCGVYLEGLAKDGAQRRRSVALQSLGLAMYSLPAAIIIHSLNHRTLDLDRLLPLLITPKMQFILVMQAVSGMLVGAVIRHSDNVLKGFATSVSLVASACFTEPGMRVVLGTVLVAGAVCLYGARIDTKRGMKIKSMNIL